MKTLKLHITNIEDKDYIKRKQKDYSYAFHLMLKQLDKSSNKDTICFFKERFNLTDIEYRSLCSEVSIRMKQIETRKTTVQNDIKSLEDKLNTTTNKAKRYRIWRKIQNKKASINNGIVFGGRNKFIKLVKEYNNPESSQEKITELLYDFRSSRIMPFYVMGEGNKRGNRFFDLSKLSEGLCVYTPIRRIKNNISFSFDKKQKKELIQIVELINKKEIPISVSLSVDYIYFSYDEEKLNGYSLDEKSRKKDIAVIKSKNLDDLSEQEEIKQCYRKYYIEQENRKMVDKIPNRAIAIDLNPDNIGCSIVEKINDEGAYKVLKVWKYDFKYFFRHTGWKSDDERQNVL